VRINIVAHNELVCKELSLIARCKAKVINRISGAIGSMLASIVIKSSLSPVVCRGSCLIYVRCICLRIVVFNTYCGVVVFVCISPVLPVSLDCSFLIALSVFSNVYLSPIRVKPKTIKLICFASLLSTLWYSCKCAHLALNNSHSLVSKMRR